jgi:hypothetical protein
LKTRQGTQDGAQGGTQGTSIVLKFYFAHWTSIFSIQFHFDFFFFTLAIVQDNLWYALSMITGVEPN